MVKENSIQKNLIARIGNEDRSKPLREVQAPVKKKSSRDMEL